MDIQMQIINNDEYCLPINYDWVYTQIKSHIIHMFY